jgi:hypothetical protein
VRIIVNDDVGRCENVAAPEPPYTDKDAAIFVLEQDKMISICKALLGNSISKKDVVK